MSRFPIKRDPETDLITPNYHPGGRFLGKFGQKSRRHTTLLFVRTLVGQHHLKKAVDSKN